MLSLLPLCDGLPSLVARGFFWTSLLLVFYAYAGYTLLLRLLCSFLPEKAAPSTTSLSLTIIICAHNEARSLMQKLEDTLALQYPAERLQIIVASDGSTDDTDAIVTSFADRGVELVRIDRQAGKTNAQNVAVLQAHGDILVFSDATTLYDSLALQYLAGNFLDLRVGACSGHYVYVGEHGRPMQNSGAQQFAVYDNSIRHMQSRLGSVTGCCGCMYAVRRSLYTPLADYVISDLVQPLHVLAKGFRVTFESRALALETTSPQAQDEFKMRVRVVARALGGLLSVRRILTPWKHPWLVFQIASHKLVRWSVPFLLAIVLVASATQWNQWFYVVAFVLQIVFYLFAAVAWLVPRRYHARLLQLPLYFCIVNAAAAVGFVQFSLGQRYVAWRPERSDAQAA